MSFMRRYWTQVHNWVGVLITPPLAIIFFTGIVLFFHDALYQWEFGRQGQLTLPQAMDQAANRLEQQGILKEGGSLSFYPAEEGGFPLMYYGGKGYQAILADGTVLTDAIRGNAGRTLLNIHDSLSLPMGLYLAGLVAVLMLVLLINGLVVHWPNLKRQFQQYRPDSAKDKWLDLHKLVGIASLPYLLMYAITGAAFCLLVLYQALLLMGPYQGDRSALMNDMGFAQVPQAAKVAAAQLPPSALLAQSQALLGAQPNRLTIGPWKDQNQQVIATSSRGRELVETREIIFTPGAKAPLSDIRQDNMGPSRLIYGAFVALHYGHFGGITLIWLFSALGIACLGMLFGGALRAHGRLPKSGWLYHYNRKSLVLAGSLPLGTLALLLAARYLPMDSPARFWAFPWVFWVVTLLPVLWPMAVGTGRRRVACLWWTGGLFALASLGSIALKQGPELWAWALALVAGTLVLGAGAALLTRRLSPPAS